MTARPKTPFIAVRCIHNQLSKSTRDHSSAHHRPPAGVVSGLPLNIHHTVTDTTPHDPRAGKHVGHAWLLRANLSPRGGVRASTRRSAHTTE
jgi:hypothetical protein